MSKAVLSTYEASVILNVDISTVKKWVDEGKIKAFRTPGGHRRITRVDLIDFVMEYDFPAPGLTGSTGILIVDDEENVRKNIKKVVDRKFSDAVIYTAEDGFTAGKILASEDIGVLLLDIRMPGVDGMEVLRQVSRDSRLGAPYIIVMTGYPDEELEKEVEELGAKKFLIKPFGVKELSDALKETLITQ